jgi:hypothetical protein
MHTAFGSGHDPGVVMSDRAAAFVGNIPAFYDQGLGPVFFAELADDIARRVAALAPIRVLETAGKPAQVGEDHKSDAGS